MSGDTIRRWVQLVVGVALLAYALIVEQDATHRLEYSVLGALLIDPEHVLSALGIWKGSGK